MIIPTDAVTIVGDFLNANTVLVRIIITIFGAVLLRIILVSLVNRSARKVISEAQKVRDRDISDAASGKKRRKELVPSPFATERIVQRTQTLAAFSRNVITVIISLFALFIILGELAVNLTAVLASAGIIAAGLAFGAQRIVNDILNGIFMVFEDQLGVGDSVVIGDVDGTVEFVGIRITQVRSYDGTLWFIRNGEIAKIGNLSHGWGRAVCDVSVIPTSDLTQVRSVIERAVSDVLKQPDVASQVIEKPEIFGLQVLSEERATFRIAVKTHSDAQGAVLSALRSRIKTAFDAAGIRFAPEATAVFLRAPENEASTGRDTNNQSTTTAKE